MKEAYYFSHDANARQDEKILMLRAEHGWEGYGIYWALIEMMFESGDTSLHHNKIKGIAVSYNIDITLLQSVINTCITEELFVSDGEQFWSNSLLRRKQKFYDLKEKKAEAGRKGMAKRWGKDNSVITDDNDVITKNNKGKEIKENKSKGNKTKVNKSKEPKIKFADLVSMTQKEYETLLNEHGEFLTKKMIEVLDNYKGASGKPYKSDYKAILTWVRDKVLKEQKGYSNKKPVRQEQVPEWLNQDYAPPEDNLSKEEYERERAELEKALKGERHG